MRATRSAIWNALQRQLTDDVPYALQTIYESIRRTIALDDDDLAFDGVSQTKWERNVRNVLQYRTTTGQIQRTSRGEYRLCSRQERDGSQHLSPGRLRSAGFLHGRLLEALGSSGLSVPTESQLATKPLTLALAHPLPGLARFYTYLATDHPSERSLGDFRIQVMLPEHRAGTRGRFDRTDAATPFLLGYVPEFDVFVLWDADLHDAGAGVPYSKGVQVHAGTIFSAAATGWATQERRMRSAGHVSVETVIATRSGALVSALEERRRRSIESLLVAG